MKWIVFGAVAGLVVVIAVRARNSRPRDPYSDLRLPKTWRPVGKPWWH